MKMETALVLITTSFPISGDGSEAAGGFVADIAEALAVHQPVRVVAPGPRQASESWCEGVEVYRFAAPERPLSTLKPWRPADLSALARVLRSGLAAARSAVQAGPCSHILALWALPSGHWARQLSKETGVPYSVWTLGSDIWQLGRVPVIRSHLRRVLRDARHCYSDGLQLADDTARIGGREVSFLPSTRRIHTRRTQPLRQAPPYRLLFLGRWHPNKGIDLLLTALALLTDSDWSRIETVLVCGGGPMQSLVEGAVARLQSEGRPVQLRGYLAKADAENVISHSDFLVIPSRVESIPVVFSDAMKLGCPVISMPVGDLKDLLTRWRVGLLAAEVNASQLAITISNALVTGTCPFAQDIPLVARAFDEQEIAARLLSETGP